MTTIVQFIYALITPDELMDYSEVIEKRFKDGKITETEMRTALKMCFQKALMLAVLESEGYILTV